VEKCAKQNFGGDRKMNKEFLTIFAVSNMNLLILQRPSNGVQNYMNVSNISDTATFRIAADLNLNVGVNANIDDIKNSIRIRVRRQNVCGGGLVQVFQPSGRG
jgi:hypothetical protein